MNWNYGEKKINPMHLQLYFGEQKTGSCCFMQIDVSPDHGEFSGFFLKLLNIYIATESLVFTVLQLST